MNMHSKKLIDNWKQKEWLFNIIDFWFCEICEIYHYWKDYRFLIENMERQWRKFYSQRLLENTYEQDIIEIKTWIEYPMKLVFQKWIEEEKERQIIDKQNIENRRKTSLIYNN